MHTKRVTVWCEFWSRGIIGNEQWMAVTDNFCSQELKRRILATFGLDSMALRATQSKLHRYGDANRGISVSTFYCLWVLVCMSTIHKHDYNVDIRFCFVSSRKLLLLKSYRIISYVFRLKGLQRESLFIIINNSNSYEYNKSNISLG